jgi:hypothetical protein
VNAKPLETPPPGAGVLTVTVAVSGDATSATVMAACNCVLLKTVVVRLLPFHKTVEVLAKFDPFTVSRNAAAPLAALEGDNELNTATGALPEIVCCSTEVFDRLLGSPP